MTIADCHVCGAGALARIPGLEDAPRVTSDCRPWESRAGLFACDACGCLQKSVDSVWRQDMKSLYAGYRIYQLSDGEEQVVFADAGAAISRSEQLLSCLFENLSLSQHGRLIDVGSGNGAFLKAFHRLAPDWSLEATELPEMVPALRKLPGVAEVHTTSPAAIPGRFDLASLIHVLEHVEDPVAFLSGLRDRFTDRGRLLVEVPDYRQNPFDLIIADHCTHFTEMTAIAVLQLAGFEIDVATAGWVKKELTLVARPRSSGTREPTGDPDARKQAAASVNWLSQVLAQTRTLAATTSKLAIFGTSIAGTWLASALTNDVAFFVDEDSLRDGKHYMGKPIYHPQDVPADSDVFIALSPRIALSVQKRLADAGHSFRCHLPPDLLG